MDNIIVKVEELPQSENIFVDSGIHNKTKHANTSTAMNHQQSIVMPR